MHVLVLMFSFDLHYTGRGRGGQDYFAVGMQNGYVTFTFDLGSG